MGRFNCVSLSIILHSLMNFQGFGSISRIDYAKDWKACFAISARYKMLLMAGGNIASVDGGL